MENGRNKELAGNKGYPPITVADIQNGKTVFAARTPRDTRVDKHAGTRADPAALDSHGGERVSSCGKTASHERRIKHEKESKKNDGKEKRRKRNTRLTSIIRNLRRSARICSLARTLIVDGNRASSAKDVSAKRENVIATNEHRRRRRHRRVLSPEIVQTFVAQPFARSRAL